MGTYATVRESSVSWARMPLRLTLDGKAAPELQAMKLNIPRNSKAAELRLRLTKDKNKGTAPSWLPGIWEADSYKQGWKPVGVNKLSLVNLTLVDGSFVVPLFRGTEDVMFTLAKEPSS